MLEIADIFRAAGAAYRARNGNRMLTSHEKAMHDIERCRTAALGGHVRRCDSCDQERYSYHSCRNRHCPKCQGERTRRWLAAQRNRKLSCPYFFLTFTLPDTLRGVAQANQRIVYGALMSCAAQALKKLTADPRYLGASPGITAVLHTWKRDMGYHPHVHMLVTAGGLTPAGAWRPTKNPAFLVPGRALSVIFRAKVRDALAAAGLLARLPAKLWRKRKPWVVHCQHAGTGEKVLDYLGRYVFRVAIVNSRLERFDPDEGVTFRYRHRTSGELRRVTLSTHDFIARFLQHVLPYRFPKVRHYGLFASANRQLLERAKSILDNRPKGSTEPSNDPAVPDRPLAVADDPDPCCPFCQRGRLRIVQTLPRERAPP